MVISNDEITPKGVVGCLGLVSFIIFCGGPIILYFVYRLANGLSRALKGHRIGNVNKWI